MLTCNNCVFVLSYLDRKEILYWDHHVLQKPTIKQRIDVYKWSNAFRSMKVSSLYLSGLYLQI